MKDKLLKANGLESEVRIAELQGYLTSTDWYAIRFADSGVAIPEEVRAARQAAREEIDRLREAKDGGK